MGVLPSYTLCTDVSLHLGTILGTNGVDLCIEFCIMATFVQVMRILHTVMCVSTETQKNVINHIGQSQNKQSSFE